MGDYAVIFAYRYLKDKALIFPVRVRSERAVLDEKSNRVG
jgi:hypothetical protein